MYTEMASTTSGMIRSSFMSSSVSSSDADEEGAAALPSAAAIAGLVGAGAAGRSYYDSFLSSSRLMMRTGEAGGAAVESEDEREEDEAEDGEGGGLRHALGVIERLQEQLRIVRAEKQALEERAYLLQRENASLLGAGRRQQAAAGHTTAMSALSAAAEMKALEGEAKEARVRLAVVEGELAAEREEARALRARLASGALSF